MSEGDWSAPPDLNRGRWQRFADELKERPGEWRCVIDNRILSRGNGPVKQLRKAGCQVTTRQTTTLEGTFMSAWARWPAQAV